MSLTERLAAAPKGRGHSCTIGILLASWPLDHKTEERDVLLAAMVDPAWPATAIVDAVNAEGYTVKVDHMQAHRRGACDTGNCPMPRDGVRR
jgi:hypothetical protein